MKKVIFPPINRTIYIKGKMTDTQAENEAIGHLSDHEKHELIRSVAVVKRRRLRGRGDRMWWFPLEPLDERYTGCWYRWFPEVFNEYGAEHGFWEQIVGDELTKGVEEGEFLDICGRPYYAMSQICKFIKLYKQKQVNNRDSLFFADLWHHGIESIPYIRELSGSYLRVFGILHAGSYDPQDFLAYAGTQHWAKYFEKMIFNSVNKIFVGSKWHQELLDINFGPSKCIPKVKVTGLPLKCSEILQKAGKIKKDSEEKLIVFPHRIAPEKGVSEMITIMNEVFDYNEKANLIITTGRKELTCRDPTILNELLRFNDVHANRVSILAGVSKGEYYKILAKSHVVLSTALQETFGYGILEGALLGCTPVVPKRLSYPDILQGDIRLEYRDNKEAVEKICKYLDNPIDVSEYVWRYDSSRVIRDMLKEMDLT